MASGRTFALRGAVSCAMSYLQDRLYALEKPCAGQEANAPKAVPLFDQWTPADFKRLADAVDVDKLVIAKVRDRKITAETTPDEFTACLATAMRVPVERVNAHLSQPAVFPQPGDF